MRIIPFLSAVFALTLVIITNPQAAEADKVKAFADQLAGRALIIVKNDGLSADAKQSQLESLFKSHVDIQWVAKFVLGKHWRAATEEQKTAYLKNYETFMLKTYSSRITSYTGQDYEILNAQPSGEEGEYLLTMKLMNANEPPVMLDYRIRKDGSDYKIFDIIVEGVSMITTQRSEFSSVVANKGLDFLISALEKKAKAKNA